MKPGLRKEVYCIGIDGAIDEIIQYATPEQAISEAYRIYDQAYDKINKGVSVYGFCEYLDNTPSYAQTTFWRHWRISKNGFVSVDGR